MFDLVQKNKILIQVILALVALTFVGFGVGNYAMDSGEPYVAKVEGAKIYQSDIDRILEGHSISEGARATALEDLIRRRLLLVDADKQNMHVSDEQLRREIASIPEFQQDGKFNSVRYKELVLARYPSIEAFESAARQELVVGNQLAGWGNGAFAARTVVSRVYNLLNEKREVERGLLKAADFASQIKTDDTALKAYYSRHLKQYRAVEQVKLDYVVLSQQALANQIKVPEADIDKEYKAHQAEYRKEQRRASHILLVVAENAKLEEKAKVGADAKALLAELKAHPSRFAILARERSQDPGSATQGGDLGFFSQGVMVKPFDDVVFKLKPGQISDVVRTQYGYHIIKLEEIKAQTFDEVKPGIIEKLQQQQAHALFRSSIDKLTDLAYQHPDSLKAIQDALHLQPQRSDWLERNRPIVDSVLGHPKVLEAAFSDEVLKTKQNSEPIDLGDSRWVVLRVAGYQPSRQKSFTEVREQIKADLIQHKGSELAGKKGAELLTGLKQGNTESSIIAWGAAQLISRTMPVNLPEAHIRAIYATPVKRLPAYVGVKGQHADYVIYRISKVIPAATATAEDHNHVASIISRVDTNVALNSYLDVLRQKYDVIVNRVAFTESDQ